MDIHGEARAGAVVRLTVAERGLSEAAKGAERAGGRETSTGTTA